MQTVACHPLTLKAWLKQEAEKVSKAVMQNSTEKFGVESAVKPGMDIRYRKRRWELKFAVSIIRNFFHPSVLHVYHTNINLMTHKVSQTELPLLWIWLRLVLSTLVEAKNIVFKQNYFYAGAKCFHTFLTKHTINKDNFYLPS